MLDIRICKSCAQPISGSHITALGANWHPEHFCCTVCQQSITETHFYVHQERPCHPSCYENSIAPRCTLCNKALTGKYQTNVWDERYCLDHEEKLAACSYCGRLIPHTAKRTRRHSPENMACDICASTAIENAPQAKLLMPSLMGWLEVQDVHFRQKVFRIEVLDRADFLSREGGRRDPLGLTTSTRYMRHNRVDHAKIESVAILQGLPHTLFEGVFIHELGHVWLVQQNIVNLPILDEEGFCELLAHRHYVEIGSKADLFYAQRIAENSSPVYGDGFRKLKQLEERIGFAQIIKSLLRKKKLPL